MFIIIGALLLISSLNYVNWFTKANSLQLVRVARVGFVIMTWLTLGILACSGKLAVLLIGLLAFLPMMGSIQQLWRNSFASDTSLPDQGPIDNLIHVNDQNTHIANMTDDSQSESSNKREQALEILGLSSSAEDTEIFDAHQRLIKLVHPDHGGSDYLVRQINHAKQLLIG